MGDPTLNHRVESIEGATWHWVEAGDGDPVVLLHGIPESWQCWKHQIPTLVFGGVDTGPVQCSRAHHVFPPH